MKSDTVDSRRVTEKFRYLFFCCNIPDLYGIVIRPWSYNSCVSTKLCWIYFIFVSVNTYQLFFTRHIIHLYRLVIWTRQDQLWVIGNVDSAHWLVVGTDYCRYTLCAVIPNSNSWVFRTRYNPFAIKWNSNTVDSTLVSQKSVGIDVLF